MNAPVPRGRLKRTCLAALLAACCLPATARPDAPQPAADYRFDDALTLGTRATASLSRFNRANAIEPGRYQVDIYLNNTFVTRAMVDFQSVDAADVSPCLSDQFLLDAGLKPSSLNPQAGVNGSRATEANCAPLSQRLDGIASSRFDLSRLRLDLSIAQSLMTQVPRNHVAPSDWDAGTRMAFFNYNTHYYHSAHSGGRGSNTDNAYLGLNSGINLGLWRLRQQSSARYSSSGAPRTDWSNVRTYAQRALPALDSEMTLGESFTAGDLFASMAFRGVQLGTDERMQAESLRGYAPQVRGIAETHARVQVKQSGRTIYETSVAPGAFIIDDLYGTSYQGDLEVEVLEADGRLWTFTVPFTAVPDSMRPGLSRYNATLGQARYVGDNDLFADFTYQRGLDNNLTLNSGVRVADDYLALLGGGVLATAYGAFGLNSTFSSARTEHQQRNTGWRLQSTYSKTFLPTSTTVSLAGYRYSTQGYRDLSDVLGVRESARNNTTWRSGSYQQRTQLTANISQSLGDFGQFYLSASTSDYYSDSSRDTQLQLGYSHHWQQLSYSLSVSRQESRRTQLLNDDQQPQYVYNRSTSNRSNMVMLSLSMPLGSSPNSPYLFSSVTHNSTGGNTYQSSLSGTLDEAQNLSYGVDASHNDQDKVTAWGGSLQQRRPLATLGGNFAQGQNYWQASANARGAAVLHSDGLTLGPYLSDTFGLIEAKGASGAEVRNGQGAKINPDGYALIPSLSAYRYNDVGLNSTGLNRNAELQDNQRRVAPYAGAAVKVQFRTLVGHALLIKARHANGEPLPLGANVTDEQGTVIGMVGQASQIYARVANRQGALRVTWGDAPDQGCELRYALTDSAAEQALIRLNATCQQGPAP
ncbi:fimbria/pilus outer membrane usher protein [Pseudomonas sp. Au-Pse12]|uniref:fimbria/pilus outer membrane usher protein n=1 Tax=Pseudomonas sp. Au-Pse12 TaxID=2906459 RepID=UPI001E532C38|nr:fimbria/pilus outer membrane usher protein [Pseudomonas sp. Au-Pse12]MCE4053919.1 fimbrial biogenesis outer membrane usher protein [Pseudomonas sp. Au-Pse12]